MTTVQPRTSATQPAPARRGLRALIAAVAVSSLGDGAFTTAAPLAAAAVTHNPAAVAAVAAAEMLPWLLVTPVAGALVDRWPARPVMVVADIARAVALAALAVLIATGHASIPALAIAACLAMVGMTFHDTAAQIAVVDLAGRDSDLLETVNGRIASVTTAGKELIGQPTGSAIYALVAWLPFLGDALSFAGSAGLLATLPRTDRPRPAGPHESLAAQIRGGAVWLARQPTLRSFCVLITAANLAYSAAMSTLVLYATQVLQVPPAAYGLLMATAAVGGITGGLTASRIIRWLGPANAMMGAMFAQVAAFLLLVLTASPWLAAIALALASVGTAVAGVVAVSSRQRLTPADRYGRVTALFRMFGVGVLPVGAALGGGLATLWGLHAPLWFAAAFLSAALIAWPLMAHSRSDG